MADSRVKRASTKCGDETRCAATDRKSLASCPSTGNDRIWPHLRGHRICDRGEFHGKPARARRSDLARGAAHGASYLSMGDGDIRLLDSGRAEPKCPDLSRRFHTLCFTSICRSFGPITISHSRRACAVSFSRSWRRPVEGPLGASQTHRWGKRLAASHPISLSN
jgi:hypothetical protein